MKDRIDMTSLTDKALHFFFRLFLECGSKTGITLLVLYLLSFSGSVAHARDLVQPALSVEGLTQEQQRVYLDGLADGFQIINAKVQRQGQQPLYCIPEKVVVLGRDLLEFAAEDLQGPQEDLTIAVSGLLGLMERYPCSKEKEVEPLPTKDSSSKKKGESG